MKYSVVAIAALAGLVSAQTKADIPSCALSCLDDAASGAGCSKDDTACLCKNVATVQVQAATCVIKACGKDTAYNEVLPAAKALCENLGSGGDAPAKQKFAEQSSMPAQEEMPATTETPAQDEMPAAAEETECVTTMIARPTMPAGNQTQPTGMPPVTGGASKTSAGVFALIAAVFLAL